MVAPERVGPIVEISRSKRLRRRRRFEEALCRRKIIAPDRNQPAQIVGGIDLIAVDDRAFQESISTVKIAMVVAEFARVKKDVAAARKALADWWRKWARKARYPISLKLQGAFYFP